METSRKSNELKKAAPSLRIGVVSDTHGLLRPQAIDFLKGCAQIVHAGDIGNADVLDQLNRIAPVIAVRGNNDKGEWARDLPETELFPIGNRHGYLIHDLNELDIDPQAAGVSIVICGHTHQPKCEERNGCLYLNPGAAGPRRFKLPISIGEIELQGGTLQARLVTLIY